LLKGRNFARVRKKIIKGMKDSRMKKADMAPKAVIWSSLHFLVKSMINCKRSLNLLLGMYRFNCENIEGPPPNKKKTASSGMRRC
jgi:hypothetical protein